MGKARCELHGFAVILTVTLQAMALFGSAYCGEPIATPICVSKLKSHGGFDMRFSPDGRFLGTSECAFWDVRTGKYVDLPEMREWMTASGSMPRSLTFDFSPDGKRIATGCQDGLVRLWDFTTGQREKDLIGIASPIRLVRFAPDGKHLTAWYHEVGVLSTWNLEFPERAAETVRLGSPGVMGALSQDVRYFAFSRSRHGDVELWDIPLGQLRHTLHSNSEQVFAITFSLNGTRVAVGSRDNPARVWDTEKGEEVLRIEHREGGEWFFPDGIHALAFSPNAEYLACGDRQGVRICDAHSGKLIFDLNVQPKPSVRELSFSSDGKALAVIPQRGLIELWTMPVAPR